ncbi:MAG: DNRLRE domain-containing protein [Phycisphaerales bacterium JB063]
MTASDQLIYRYLDRDLDAEGCAQLQAWLASDPAHAARFALIANEQYLLREVARQATVALTIDTEAELLRSLLLMEQSAQAEPVTWQAPRPARPKPRAEGRRIEPSDAGPRAIVIPRWAVGAAVLAAAMVAVVVLLKPNTPTPQPTPPQHQATADASAVIEDNRGGVWEAQPHWAGSRGDRLPNGTIRLAEGEVTVRFDGGARVVLTGPCVFSIKDGWGIQLEAGRAVVQSAPWENGFTLTTAHQRIVDRDTTFGVEVVGGVTQLQVFRGEVDLYAPDTTADPAGRATRAGVLDAFRIEAGGQPTAIPFDVDRYQTASTRAMLPTISRRTLVFREGENGYRGTADTWFSVRQDPAEHLGFAQGTYLRIGQWSGVNQQALVRFDNLFGNAATQVPSGAQVEQATLVLHNPGDITDSFGSVSPQGDPFAVYTLQTRWAENDRYASAPWAGGPTPQVDTDGREASAQPVADCQPLALQAPDRIIPANTRIELDVTAPAARWAKGEENLGLLLQSMGPQPGSPNANGEGDSIFVASSEYTANPALRPALEVTYLVVSD